MANSRRHGRVTKRSTPSRAKSTPAPWRRLGISREQYRQEIRTTRELQAAAKKRGLTLQEYTKKEIDRANRRLLRRQLQQKEAAPGPTPRQESDSDKKLRESVKLALGPYYSPQFWRDFDVPCRAWCDYFCAAVSEPIVPPDETSEPYSVRRELWDQKFWHALVLSGGPWGFRGFHRRNKRSLADDIIETWQAGESITFSAKLLVHFRVSHAKLSTLKKQSKTSAAQKPRKSIRERYKLRGGHVYDGKKRLSDKAEREYWLWHAQQKYRRELENIRARRRGVTT